REHSASRKDNITWLTNFQHNRHQFQSMVWYTNLFYQTPGGLTKAQWVLNPKLSRPATTTLPSAITQKAAIYNSTLFVGLQHQLSISQFHRTYLSFVTSQSTIKNPFITNYETRNEWNIGVHGKSVFQKKVQQINIQWINGFELLQNFSTIANFGNRTGEKDTLQLRDKVKALQSYVYSQLQLSHSILHATLGLSINRQQLKYKRVSSGVNNYVTQNTPIQATPRLAIALSITPSLTVYSSIAKGFSPPSLAEVRPSDGNFYTQLTGENGFNTEIGLKGSFGEKRFQFDLTVYRFVLNDAIVRRNTNSGTEYFINAGSIRQEGIEWFSKWLLFNHPKGLLQQVSLTTSVSYQPYQFISYQQGNANFSGNKVTGVPMYNVVNTCFIQFKKALYTEISHQYVHKTPLNDANDIYASDYRLVQIRVSHLIKKHHKQYRFFLGVDNLLNENYSLGNDINAVGRRYFNAAPTINFFGGIKMAW
ncbi:MAG: TonB-dependent receptor domain-containing protein, partial [Chitinophagaceae bacterium]